MPGRSSPRHLPTTRLPWGLPPLSNPRMVTITGDGATRRINLNPGEDAWIYAPDVIEFAEGGTTEAIVQVFGGRHVVWIGGHIRGDGGPITALTQPMSENTMTVTVASTAGFPTVGYLRIDGEGMKYTGKTATTFTVTDRRSGHYNTSSSSSDTTHSVGATVYLGEYSRTGVQFSNQTGAVHMEGVLMDGFINDGVRLIGTPTMTATLQNLRIGPTRNHEPATHHDGHPDGVQIWGPCAAFRMANSTITAGRGGRAILHSAPAGTLKRVEFRNVDFITDNPVSELVRFGDPATIWRVDNGWARSYKRKADVIESAALAAQFCAGPVVDSTPDFCPPWVPGVGYRSPGYIF